MEILKQGQYAPLAVEKQIIIIFAGTNGFLDSLEVTECQPFEQALYRFMDSNHPSLGKGIRERKQLDDSLQTELKKAISEFKEKFVSERGQSVSV